jgi:hypothetical protein
LTRYKIILKCAGCGYTLYTVHGGGRHGGRGAGHLSIEKVRRHYDYTCPVCGRRLEARPAKIEFTTLKEYEERYKPSTTPQSRMVAFYLPTWADEAIERLVASGAYKSKSEFLRKAVMKLLEEHGLKPP